MGPEGKELAKESNRLGPWTIIVKALGQECACGIQGLKKVTRAHPAPLRGASRRAPEPPHTPQQPLTQAVPQVRVLLRVALHSDHGFVVISSARETGTGW